MSKLVASKGKILTNGTIYGRVLYLSEFLSEEDFFEITEEQYQQILLEERKKQEELSNEGV